MYECEKTFQFLRSCKDYKGYRILTYADDFTKIATGEEDDRIENSIFTEHFRFHVQERQH